MFYLIIVVLSLLLFLIATLFVATYPIRALSRIRYLLQYGERIPATVIDSRPMGKPNAAVTPLMLTLQFTNFTGSPVQEQTLINDSRPYEERYVKGRQLTLLVDRHLKQQPYFIPEGIQARLNYLLVGIFLLTWLAFAIGAVILLKYFYDQAGGELAEMFDSVSAVVVFLFIIDIMVLALYMVNKNLSNGQADKQLRYFGQLAEATVTGYERTGTLINDNPVIRFKIQFRDKRGATYNMEIKKLVDLIHLGTLNTLHKTQVLYLPENPGKVAFASDNPWDTQ